MSILNFSYADVKDVSKFKEYITAAAQLMHASGVDVVVRGEFIKAKRGGDKSPHIAAVFRYPDLKTAEEFYESEDYKALIPLRDEACDMSIYFYEE